MSCESRCVDPIQQEAAALTGMLDSGRQSAQLAEALRADSYNMSPNDFNRLVSTMQQYDRKDLGDNLEVDGQGNLIIDTGQQGLVVATRDWDMRQRYAQTQQPAAHRQPERQGNDPLTEGVVQGGIGAGVGAIINGKDGAIAGAAGGIGNVIIDEIGGEHNRDPLTDTVVKAGVGAAIGAIIDGEDGAISGAAGSALPNILRRVWK